MSKKIVIYSKNGCQPCRMSKMLLDNRNVEYEERNVDTSEQYLEELKELGLKGVPAVVVNGELEAVGFQPDVLNSL